MQKTKTICDYCDCEVDEIIIVDGDEWCKDCVDDEAFCCDNCGVYSHKRNEYDVQGDALCESCADDESFMCNCCGIRYYNDNGVYCESLGETLCRECYNDNWTCCDCCDAEISFDDCDGDGNCPDCQCDNEIIHDYGYRPKLTFRKLAEERPLYYGIELEVENEGNKSNNDIAESLSDDYIYCKEDCSINHGFEIVSHPASYRWLKKHINIWEKILDIRIKGFLSSKTKTCGMHIHIDKEYFTEKHLYKFLKFFYENANFIMFISGRSENNFNHWSTLKDNAKTIEYKAKHKRGNYERNCAVNLENDKTIEIRIFKGTLFPRSFWKNIEFLESIIRYSKRQPKDKMTEEDYLGYIKRTKRSFPNLHEWLKDKEKIK